MKCDYCDNFKPSVSRTRCANCGAPHVKEDPQRLAVDTNYSAMSQLADFYLTFGPMWVKPTFTHTSMVGRTYVIPARN